MKPDDFTATYGPLAEDISQETGLAPHAILGIVAQETGFGDHFIGNNIFGISPSGPRGQYVAQYPSIQDAGRAFVDLMKGRYQDASSGATPEDQVRLISARGYNTNPAYPGAVAQRIATLKGNAQQMASDDDLMQRIKRLRQPAPEAATGGPGAAAAPASPDAGTPSDDALLARIRAIAPAQATTAAETAKPEPPAQDPYSGAPTTVDYRPDPNVTGALSRVGQAAAEGWQGGTMQTPEAYAANQQTLLGKYGVNPLVEVGNLPFRALNALGRGGAQAIYEAGEPLGRALPEIRIPDNPVSPVGQFLQQHGISGTILGGPGLGRDLNLLAQVAPVAQAEGGMMRSAMQPPVAPEVNALRPTFVSERTAPPRPPGMTDAERIQQLVEHSVNAEQPPVGPARPQGGVAGPTEDGGGPQPGMGAAQPAGAQATPSAAAQMTPEQIATQRTVADKQWLNQTQQPGVRDTTEHIPGITPNLVEQEQTVTAARELKALKNLNPELSQAEREILDRNTDLRKGHFAETVGSDVTRAGDLKAANDKINTDLADVWKGKGDADPAAVHTQIETELAGSAGELPPVKSAMKQVSDSLENAGNDPQAMYRTHRLINYLQSKQGQLANPGYGAGDVQAALTRVKATLAKTIDDAAPGFGNAMSDYSSARGPIDAAKALQDRENGLYDSRGHMSFLKVHALMRDIIDAQKWDAPNDPLAGVSEAQMARLKALHDDLKRTASAKDLATAQGSDTAMNAVDIAKAYGKLATRAGVEGAANVAFGPGVGSMIVRGAENLLRPITSGVAARRQVRRGMEILQPPPTNPLQPPSS